MVCSRSVRSRRTRGQARHDVVLMGACGSYERSLGYSIDVTCSLARRSLFIVDRGYCKMLAEALYFCGSACSDQLCKFDAWPVLQSWAELQHSEEPRGAVFC